MCEKYKLIEGENAKICTKCGELRGFGQFYKNKTGKYGVRSQCKDCDYERTRVRDLKLRQWDEVSVIDAITNWDTLEDLKRHAKGAYCWMERHNKLHLCDHLRQNILWDIGQVKLEALKYNYRTEFSRGASGAYHWARVRGLLDKVCGHMKEDLIGGRNRTAFIERCQQKLDSGKGDGLATLYMIICWNSEELFYKIGITSNTVKRRYYGKKNMPYNYRIMWQIRTEPSKIWDMEGDCRRQTKESRYQPKLWEGKAKETFIL